MADEIASSVNNDEQKTNEQEKIAKMDEDVEGSTANNENCTDEDPSVSNKEQLSVEEKEKDSAEEGDSEKTPPELVNFRMVWNKKNYDVEFDVGQTVDQLKEHIEGLTGLPVSMQKLMYKGLLKDGSKLLRDVNITSGCKMMVVGSTINDVLKVTPPAPSQLKEEKGATATTKEPLCKHKMHKKVLDKGKPDDILPGIKNRKESLPNVPLTGMYNKYGSKVRLTFKLELDQLWLGTKERTEKIPMGSIKNVISEAIEGHEEYHMLAIQLGPTEASRYWIYWVPAQYVNAIKDTVLGKWQPF